MDNKLGGGITLPPQPSSPSSSPVKTRPSSPRCLDSIPFEGTWPVSPSSPDSPHLPRWAHPPRPIRHGHARSIRNPSPHCANESCAIGGFPGPTVPTSRSTSSVPSTLPAKPAQLMEAQVPNGYPGKSSSSLELKTDDSTSSDGQVTDPFNPDSSVSDNDGNSEDNARSPKSSLALDDRPRESFGSAPHPAPSDGSSPTPPSKVPFTRTEHSMHPATDSRATSTAQDIPSSMTRSAGQMSPEQEQGTSPSSSAKDRKPPPPPRSHHGRRISATANPASSSSRSTPPRSTNRLSHHASSPESLTSARVSDTPDANPVSNPPPPDYFSVPSDGQRATDSTDSLHRSNSQQKRPPTPPLSRRRSQMRRPKSAQSKSSGSRLTMSSRDSESNDSSQPPSPGPSTRSVASSISQDRKRISMPPPSSGDLRAAALSSGMALDSVSLPTNSKPSRPGRRASSHGTIFTGSSSVAPPPPPPPRRSRDSNARSSDGGPASRTTSAEEMPLPQPSNASDILADLTRLQKEVDDLRGHYENRKVSQ